MRIRTAMLWVIMLAAIAMPAVHAPGQEATDDLPADGADADDAPVQIEWRYPAGRWHWSMRIHQQTVTTRASDPDTELASTEWSVGLYRNAAVVRDDAGRPTSMPVATTSCHAMARRTDAEGNETSAEWWEPVPEPSPEDLRHWYDDPDLEPDPIVAPLVDAHSIDFAIAIDADDGPVWPPSMIAPPTARHGLPRQPVRVGDSWTTTHIELTDSGKRRHTRSHRLKRFQPHRDEHRLAWVTWTGTVHDGASDDDDEPIGTASGDYLFDIDRGLLAADRITCTWTRRDDERVVTTTLRVMWRLSHVEEERADDD